MFEMFFLIVFLPLSTSKKQIASKTLVNKVKGITTAEVSTSAKNSKPFSNASAHISVITLQPLIFSLWVHSGIEGKPFNSSFNLSYFSINLLKELLTNSSVIHNVLLVSDYLC